MERTKGKLRRVSASVGPGLYALLEDLAKLRNMSLSETIQLYATIGAHVDVLSHSGYEVKGSDGQLIATNEGGIVIPDLANLKRKIQRV